MYIHPEFLKLIDYCHSQSANQDDLINMITVESGTANCHIVLHYQTIAPRVYSFPVFTENFCQRFIEELDNFEQCDIPKGRPNTMNNTGVS